MNENCKPVYKHCSQLSDSEWIKVLGIKRYAEAIITTLIKSITKTDGES